VTDGLTNGEAGATVQPCPLKAQTPPVHWIEIELIGQDDHPIPYETYSVKLPNGDVARGYLDGQGRARVENIGDAGSCEVTFPDLDKAAWEPA
jgi:hypothetical protein